MTQLTNQMQGKADICIRAQAIRQTYYVVRHGAYRFRNNLRAARERFSGNVAAYVQAHPLLSALGLLFSAPLAVLGFVFAGTAAVVVPVALLLGYAW